MVIRYSKERECQKEGKDTLLLGRDYICLAIVSYGGFSPNKVIIEGDVDGYPRLFDLDYFDIIDPRIPEGWIFLNGPESYFYLSPKEFKYDFWSGLEHAGEPNLLEDCGEVTECIFIMVVNKIRAFHNMPARDKIWRQGII